MSVGYIAAGRYPVKVRRGGDDGLGVVDRHRHTKGVGDVSGLDQFGDTADLDHVRLENVRSPVHYQVPEHPTVVGVLPDAIGIVSASATFASPERS